MKNGMKPIPHPTNVSRMNEIKKIIVPCFLSTKNSDQGMIKTATLIAKMLVIR
ncbi:MAG: hypothetical protein ACLFO6_00690 [Archaeoglobaceae archaeon]